MIHLTSGYLPSPSSNGFYLGPLFVHAYGLAYVFAVVAAVTITARRWEAVGGQRELVYDVALWGFPAGVIGGRLYFLATSWNEVPPHWWGPFAIWKGGLGIWGGIALGTLVGIWVLRRHRANVPLFMDAAAPALLSRRRSGGSATTSTRSSSARRRTLPWGLEISPAHRPAAYAHFATFQPTFLYELIWNLLLAAALVWLGHHRRIKPPGLFALYVAGYSFARIGEELLRVDPAHHILGLRLNLYVASILCLVGLAWFARIQRGVGLEPDPVPEAQPPPIPRARVNSIDLLERRAVRPAHRVVDSGIRREVDPHYPAPARPHVRTLRFLQFFSGRLDRAPQRGAAGFEAAAAAVLAAVRLRDRLVRAPRAGPCRRSRTSRRRRRSPCEFGGLSGPSSDLNSRVRLPSTGPSTASAIGVQAASITAAAGLSGWLTPYRLAPSSTHLLTMFAASSASLLGAGPPASNLLDRRPDLHRAQVLGRCFVHDADVFGDGHPVLLEARVHLHALDGAV